MTVFASGRGAMARPKTAGGGGGGDVPGALPAFGAAGTPTASATLAATHTIAHPATVGAGDILICACIGRNTDGDRNLAMHANMSAAGWAHLTESPFVSGNLVALLAWKEAVGDEDGTNIPGGVVGTGGATGNVFFGVCFNFTAADGFHASPFEDLDIADADGAGGGTVNMPTVTPGDVRRLAVSILTMFNDNTIAAATGETGGDWTEVLEVSTNVGADASIQVQVSDQSSGGAISGGTTVLGGNTTGIHTKFALAPADVPA